jgi:netrin-G3 ligand
MLGGSLNLTCVAVGSPMPFVKWRLQDEDLTPENDLPVGKSILALNDIRTSANYTCVASSSLGVIEANAVVKVQCKFFVPENFTYFLLSVNTYERSPFTHPNKMNIHIHILYHKIAFIIFIIIFGSLRTYYLA